MAKAVKKIKKGIMKNPKDPDNWIVWGLILRTIGNYASAKHKFKKALKLDKSNRTAAEELATIERIIELDEKIPLVSVPSLSQSNSIKNYGGKLSKCVCVRICSDTCEENSLRHCNHTKGCIIY